LPSLKPDLVLMDLNMPGIGGIEATRQIAQKYPGVRVVALTALSESPFPASLHEAGASGYIGKGCAPEELFEGLRAVSQGRPFISAEVSRKLSIEHLYGRSDSPFSQLSLRQLDVILLMLKGHKQPEIAELLQISPKTVSVFRNRAMEKLGVDSEVALTLLCLRHGLVADDRV